MATRVQILADTNCISHSTGALLLVLVKRYYRGHTTFFADGVLKGLSYLPTPPLEQDVTQGQFLSGV